ncbi:helix-turn-helix transcriptional regulator [Paenibacillus radicis (ex Xue et al. 2023)]|uniref:AraC family transcriptional regulator n=1 Tax=Paenibacillus radicis (ex Xue et al. 2023) TaxID=2972489 RepID=A0ABT1YVA3_9BACL|nr:AraC family transcriptional regulator [Paenibacillus radicis (ex Xue et al. 2023)]MCR8636880.1 AraC family transcriptional regulator [Paenibacillus radicis (ex Xue et al. 2023)]
MPLDKDTSFLVTALPEPYDEVNFYNRRENWSMDEHNHHYYQFIFVINGILLFKINGEVYPLKRGQLCITPPLHYHSLSSDTGYYQMGINLQPEKDHKGLISLLDAYIQDFTVIEQNHLLDVLPSLEKECKELTKLSKIKVANMMDELLVSCVEKAVNRTEIDFKNQLLTFLHKNLNRKVTLQEVSRELTISQSHLERLVKKEFGCGVIELYNQLRINKACSLLSNSHYSIENISEHLGFYDTSHFSHFFKQKIKMNPTQYRKHKNWTK